MKFAHHFNLTAYANNDALARSYLAMNRISGAFVERESERHWKVFSGTPEERTGFLSGEFTTKREAKALCDRINARIAKLS